MEGKPTRDVRTAMTPLSPRIGSDRQIDLQDRLGSHVGQKVTATAVSTILSQK
jgi:hypothetical protein